MRQIIIIILVLLVVVTFAKEENINKSSSDGLLWSTTREQGEPLSNPLEVENSLLDNPKEDDYNGIDGGFSSLDGMLQWAIGHSDPSKLKETAQDVKRLSPNELKARQMEIKELMDKLKMPSDSDLMQIALTDLNSVSLSLEDRHRALEELLILVEPIDNANDLGKLGGLAVVIRELGHPEPKIRTISAWIIGKASQNNPTIQKQVLELGALAQLLEMVQSNCSEEATKALYAVSALIRNNFAGQELFYELAGDLLLQNILSNPGVDVRLQKKSLFLLSDLVAFQFESEKRAELPFSRNHSFLKSVVDLFESVDLDLQEKALYAVKNLLQLEPSGARVFKDFCKLDVALERMRMQLEQLMVEEDHKEFAQDVESLRREVELSFLEKLDNA